MRSKNKMNQMMIKKSLASLKCLAEGGAMFSFGMDKKVWYIVIPSLKTWRDCTKSCWMKTEKSKNEQKKRSELQCGSRKTIWHHQSGMQRNEMSKETEREKEELNSNTKRTSQMKGERCKMILDITGVPDAPPIDLFLQESRAEKTRKRRSEPRR